MARPLSSPSLSVPGSNWWEKKERLQNYRRQCFGRKERKRNLFPPHLNATLFTPIIISSSGLRITSANMCYARGQGHVWSERCQVFFLEDVRDRRTKILILIIFLALNIQVLLMILSSEGLWGLKWWLPLLVRYRHSQTKNTEDWTTRGFCTAVLLWLQLLLLLIYFKLTSVSLYFSTLHQCPLSFNIIYVQYIYIAFF